MSYIIYLDGVAIYFLISRTLSILSFLHCCLLELTYFFPFHLVYTIFNILIEHLDCATRDFLISRTLSILSFLLCSLSHWHFLFLSISNVLYHSSWWCCYRFFYLKDLIHSIFSTLPSFTIDSYFFFPSSIHYLKYLNCAAIDFLLRQSYSKTQ